MRIPKTLTGSAADYWKRNAPLCVRMGTLLQSDLDTFVVLCQVYAKLQDTKEDDTIRFVCLTKQYANYAKLFGLDPVSRQKLGLTLDEETTDEFGFDQ